MGVAGFDVEATSCMAFSWSNATKNDVENKQSIYQKQQNLFKSANFFFSRNQFAKC
jgi:hypothetical protein